ncbi:polymer-forming cytoskeletal protein [Candidatus Dojkabacteria bacterium]|jgi:cytoskeletal protein CcmA (bactofilin family)|nr:polymer-forming cytoskeletal protein [Candidatus Dojkabacteria bacterium]
MLKLKEQPQPSFNILSNGTELIGDITINGDFRVDGTIKGNIKCVGKITVGTTASIEGKIECENAEIAGQICGDIKTSELTIFKDTANFHGNFSTSKLYVETGAKLNMTCDMGKKEYDK